MNTACYLRFLVRLLAGFILVLPAAIAQPPGAAGVEAHPLDTRIVTLMGDLGLSKAGNASALARLRPLVDSRRKDMSGHRAPPGLVLLLEEGSWNGEVELLVIDEFDDAGRPTARDTQIILHDNAGGAELYFLGEQPPVETSGGRLEVTGYRSGNRILVWEYALD